MGRDTRPSRVLLTGMLVLGTLVLAALACYPGPTPTPAATATPTPMSIADIVEALTPSTVLIYAEFPDGASTGTGIIYNESGLTITNAHVVEGAAIIKAYVQGIDRWLSAQLIGISPCEDLAIIDISGDGYTPATMGDSSELTLGEDVIAIGYPLASQLGAEPTITRGVVSKLHAELDELQDTIQTDVDINPGNSGGPLVNLRGQVVGINTAKIDYTSSGRPVTGINFAIAFSYAQSTIEKLVDGQNPYWIGANVIVNDVDVASYFGLAVNNGLFVYAISDNSPATDLGLEPGDVLLSMKGIEVNTVAGMCDILRSNAEGQSIPVEVMRGPDLLTGQLWGEALSGTELTVSPYFGPVTFAEEVTDDGQPINPSTSFPTGTPEVYAIFNYSGLEDGTEWTSTWYLDEQVNATNTWAWNAGQNGIQWVSLFNDAGLTSGNYRLELYVEGQLLQTGTMAVGEKAGPLLGPISFAEGATEDDQPINPTTSFPPGTTEVYAFFDYSGMEDGMAWTPTWYADGEQVATNDWTWEGGESGNWWVTLYNDNGLASGDYELEIYVEGQLLRSGTFVIEAAPSR